MALSVRRLLGLIIREALSSQGIERCPEPSEAMTDAQSVEAFHAQGEDAGALVPVYHFNALAVSSLLPKGGVVVDLGSGSGQFLKYLANLRPDSLILGIDMSGEMIERGRKTIGEAGLEIRVKLVAGDMTKFSSLIPKKVDVICNIFALHHLSSYNRLAQCLTEIVRVGEKTECAVWLFDHVRPRYRRTADIFPEIFTPHTSVVFRRDSRNSLLASFFLKS
jgi:arsenite methyltransferase